MMSDIVAVIIWWLTIFLIGTITLPITYKIFKNFADRGYIFSKVIGIVLSSYTLWLLSSIHVIPFERISIIVILLGIALANIILNNLKSEDNRPLPWKLIIFEEILFLAALIFWSYVRATEPSIRGLEKFMDFGFVNSILRAKFFPPLDMWLTQSPDYSGGNFINYYYFGHYVMAFLTKLSGLDSAVTYNLMLSTLFAFTFTLPFSIGMNLSYLLMSFRAHGNFFQEISSVNEVVHPVKFHQKFLHGRNLPPKDIGNRSLHSPDVTSGSVGMTLQSIIIGLLAAFLVSLGGNLHTIYSFTSNYPNESPQPPWNLSWGFYPERYWYPNATRFIPFTIHEFPIYSFVVADVHGHVSDIPFVLLTLALLLALVVDKKWEVGNEKLENEVGIGKRNHTSHIKNPTSHLSLPTSHRQSFLQDFEVHTSIPFHFIAFLGVLLAVMYMTNAWDGMIYMILTGLVFLYINIQGGRTPTAVGVRPLWHSLYRTFSASLFLLFFFLVASLPFSLSFKPFVSGIGVLCAPKAILGKNFGPFLFETGKCQKSEWWQLLFLWGFFYFNVIGYLLFVIIPNLGNKLSNNESKKRFIILNFRNWSASWRMKIGNLNSIDVFVLLLIFISTLLLIFPEFFYVKDIYPAHYRANTMFKLGYQAFMMLGIVCSYVVLRIKFAFSGQKKRLSVVLYNGLFIALFTIVAIYPYFAINSYYGGLKTYRGLFGLNWMQTQYPDDYQGVLWLRNNVVGQPVIVEANGDSYTDYGRVSANTGLPTIIGWPVHEWLWRGSYDEAGKRIPEVAAIYEDRDPEHTKNILRKYNVEYIFLGALEKEKYKKLDEEKLTKLGTVVFESGNTKVLRVNPVL